MDKALKFGGKKYISAKNAAKIFGYTSDYVGQLCRGKKIEARLVGRSWYVCEKDILDHKNHQNHSANFKKSAFGAKKIKKVLKKSGAETFQENIQTPILLASKKEFVNNPSKTYLKKDESRIGELHAKKILYSKDNKELFPNIVKKFDAGAARYIALKSVEESIGRTKKVPFIEKFAVRSAVILFVLVSSIAFAFGRESGNKLIPNHFGGHVKEEISFLYGSGSTQNNNQLASSIFSDRWQSVTGWIIDAGYKLIKPWLSKNVPVLVEEKSASSTQVIVINQINQTTPAITQAKTVYITSSDREYVDMKIAELKNYFLINPLAPNVNRYYVSRQNDVLASLGRNSGGGSVTYVSSGASSLSDLSDLTLSSPTYGDVLMYDGTEWANVATSSLGIAGTGASFGQGWEITAGGFLAPTTTIPVSLGQASSTLFSTEYASSTKYFGAGLSACDPVGGKLQWNADGTFSCGSDQIGGVGAGDISSVGDVGVGAAFDGTQGTTLTFFNAGGNATLSYDGSKFNFSKLISSPYASTTYSSFVTASTTNLNIGGSLFTSLLGSGLSNIGGALTLDTSVVNSFIAASSTIPKTYTANTFTALQNFANASSTLFSSTYASSTNAYFGTLSLNGTDLQATLNSKQAAISTTWPITLTGAVLGFNGLSTSSAAVLGNIPYFSSANTFANVATTSVTAGGGIILNGVFGALVGGTSPTITAQVGTSSVPSIGNLAMWTSAGTPSTLGSIGTSTPGLTSPITYSGTLGNFIGGISGNLGCTTAASGVAGCLSSTMFDTFNGKENALTFTFPLIRTTNSITFGGLSTSSAANIGYIPYFSSANTFANVATSTVTPATPLNGSFNVIGSSGSLGWSGLATSSAGSIGNLLYFSSASGVANVATTSVTAGGGIILGGVFGALVGGTSPTITAAVSTSSVPSIGYLAMWTGAGTPSTLGSVATGTITCSGTDSCATSGLSVIGGNLTITGAYDAWSHPWFGSSATGTSLLIGTTTGNLYSLTIASSTAPQLSLSNGGGSQWTLRNAGGNLYLATTTADGTATTTTSALSIIGSTGAISLATTTSGCLNTSASGIIYSATCSTGGGTGWASTTDTTSLSFTGTGYVGIGTTTPKYLLDLATTTAVQLSLNGASTDSAWFFRSIGNNLYIGTSSPATFATTTTSAFTILGSSGNVGIGTTSPANLLDVNGNQDIQGRLVIGGTDIDNASLKVENSAYSNTLYFRQTKSSGTVFGLNVGSTGAATTNVGGWFNILSATNNTQIMTGNISPPAGSWGIYQGDDGSNYFKGSMGIGTTSIGSALVVQGSGATSGTSALNVTNSSGTSELFVRNDGNVGIGTTSPGAKLHVSQADTTDIISALYLENNSYTLGGIKVVPVGDAAGGYLSFAGNATVAVSGVPTTITGQHGSRLPGVFGYLAGTTKTNSKFYFRTAPIGTSQALTEVMTILNGGNVGIGTTSPVSKLTVQGNLAIAGDGVIGQGSIYGKLDNLSYATLQLYDGIGNGYTKLNNQSYGISLQTAGTDKVTILNGGNVGIGTTTPQYLLTVASTTGPQLSLSAGAGVSQWLLSNEGGNFYLATTTTAGTATSSPSALTITNAGDVGIGSTTPWADLSINPQAGNTSFAIGSSTATYFMVNSTGNVGIATTSPSTSYKLDVTGNGYFSTGVTLGTALAISSGGTGNTAQATNMLMYYDGSKITATSSTLYIDSLVATSTTRNSTFASFVGIATTTLNAAQLTVASTTGPQLSLSAGAGVSQWLLSNEGGNFYLATTTTAGTATSSPSALTITNAGDVGIGSTTPWADLSINPQAGNTSFAIGSSTATYFMVNSTGNVGIATVTPWRKFSLQGYAAMSGLNTGAGAGALCLSSSNEVLYNAGTACFTSSLRFKHDILTATSSSGLELVDQLRPVIFTYNDNIGIPGEQYGFIAEEVEKIDPRLVVLDAQGLPFSVKYDQMTAVLAKAVQELNLNLGNIASSTATSTPESQSFAASFFSNLFNRITIWLADATNGISDIFANTFQAKEKICVDGECLTKDDVHKLLQIANGASAPAVGGGPTPEPTSTTTPEITPSPVATSTEPTPPTDTSTTTPDAATPPADTTTTSAPADTTTPPADTTTAVATP